MIKIQELLKIENEDLFLKYLELFRNKKVSEESKLRLHYFIKNLKVGTENQKEKFMYYYNIMPGNYTAKSYTEIAREYKCSSTYIRSAIRQYLTWVKTRQTEKELEKFEKIVNTTRYKNGRTINFNKLMK